MNGVELGIVIALFVIVTVMGFLAARWRRSADSHSLNEWGLGGRSFGTWITWFLLGGDLYTAYTFVAVPALVFGAGAIGFFAVPGISIRPTPSSPSLLWCLVPVQSGSSPCHTRSSSSRSCSS